MNSQIQHDCPLIGTSWIAIEMATISVEELALHPVRLAFPSEGRIAGNTGCNNFFGGAEMTDNSLTTTGHFGTTRKMCSQVMNQERNCLNFFGNKKFIYEINEPGIEEDCRELDLYAATTRARGKIVQGDMLARFCSTDNDYE